MSQYKHGETLAYPKIVHRLDFPMIKQTVKTGKAEIIASGNTTIQEDNTFKLI